MQAPAKRDLTPGQPRQISGHCRTLVNIVAKEATLASAGRQVQNEEKNALAASLCPIMTKSSRRQASHCTLDMRPEICRSNTVHGTCNIQLGLYHCRSCWPQKSNRSRTVPVCSHQALPKLICVQRGTMRFCCTSTCPLLLLGKYF